MYKKAVPTTGVNKQGGGGGGDNGRWQMSPPRSASHDGFKMIPVLLGHASVAAFSPSPLLRLLYCIPFLHFAASSSCPSARRLCSGEEQLAQSERQRREERGVVRESATDYAGTAEPRFTTAARCTRCIVGAALPWEGEGVWEEMARRKGREKRE